LGLILIKPFFENFRMQVDFTVTELIDALIYHWSFWEQYEDFYLKELLPKLVTNPKEGDEKESEIFAILCSKLNKVELETLPDLIKKRRAECLLNKVKPKPLASLAERLRQAEAERYRVETKERERQEVLRLQEEEREREKEEKQRQEDEARRNEFIPILRKALNDDFLNADSFFKENANGRISQKEYEGEKAFFVQRWIKNLVNSDLDLEQSAAIASVQDHIQVIARAGSGKTATIVNRALFLQKHCGISPNEMLL
jgi:DNA helicase-4